MKGMRRRSRKRRVIIALTVIFVIMVVIGLFVSIQPVISKARLLKEFHLPVTMAFDIEDYSYWNDFLKYTDGYEIIKIHVDAEKWEMPDVWNADEATLFEILRPYGLGFSAALRDELKNGEIPLACEAWFVSEKKPEGNFDGWEFFVGAYDGKESIFLYRGHHLYGDAELRLTGE